MSVIILTILVSCKKHKHDYKVSVVEATCTEQGYTLYTCNCGESYKDNYTDKIDHHYQNGSCTYCGKEEPHTHSYTSSVIAPSCTEEGYTLYTCSCGDTYKDNYTEKVDHHYQNGSCIYCGKEEPHTHSYTSSVIAPSCTEEGYTLYTCSCGDTYKDNYTNKIDHHYTSSIVLPSCIEEGYTLHTCSCGDTYKDNYTDKVPHTYQDGFCTHCGEREIIEYDVTFVLNYQGTTPEVHTTEQGMITFIPTREGYVFNGWWISEGSIGDEYILSKQYDMTEPVTQSGLILYAEWVEKPTEAHQLPAPNVSINQELFSWKAVPNAQSYTIQIYQNGSSQIYFQETVEDTKFLFDASSPAGYYKVLIRANGDGIHTVNSVYVSKYYAHHILSSVSHIELDMTTSILNWSFVQNATSYELYINGQIIDTLMVTQYDLSSYEAGTYTIKIVALADGYQSSIANQNVIKRRLLAPEVEVQLDSQKISYTLSWKDVALANQYILNINGEEIKISDTIYRIDMTSPYWKNETMEISIQSFDTNADYLISSSSQTIELTKKYTLEVNQNLEEAGKVSVSKEGLYQTGDTITLEATTNKGYIFDGWYDGEDLLSKDEVYSFSVSHQNMIYTAKWTYYTISTRQNAYGGGYITPFNEKITEVGESITLNATLYLGYVWDGWYDGETLLTTDFTYTFDMPSHSVTYMAKYTLQEDMHDFIFTSSETKCTITGVVDRNIEKITIPDYVTNIRKGAFQNCNKLIKITVPFIGETLNGNSNTHFGYIFGANKYQEHTQYVPESLKQIIVTKGEMIKEGSFYQCSSCTTITLPSDVTSIGANAFYKCSSLVNMILPEQVSTIGDSAFYGCTSLVQMELPDSILSLGDRAFNNCYNLSQVILSNQLMNLEEYTFSGCPLQYNENDCGKYLGSKDNPYMALIHIKDSNVTNLIIPSGVKLIRKGILAYCKYLTTLTIPFVGSALNAKTHTHFGYIFGASSYNENNKFIPSTLKEVIITGGESVPSHSFSGCKSLTNVSILGDIFVIGGYSFSGCSNLHTLTLSSSITSIEAGAFDFTKIMNLYYHGTIENWCTITVGSSPFYSMDLKNPSHHFYQLNEENQWCETTSIEIPTTITQIGRRQFEGFDLVTDITIPFSVTKIEYGAFHYCMSLIELVIPYSVNEINSCLYNCISLEKLVTPFIGSKIDAMNDQLSYFFEGTKVPEKLQVVEITKSKIIPAESFKGCTNITKVIISSPITEIGNNAFFGCTQLEYIDLPNGLIRIGEGAFTSCTHLKQMNIPNTVTQIGGSAFKYCTALTNIVLPIGIQTIESYTFSNCTGLTSITIPEGVTAIQESAFLECTKLMTVSIPNSILAIEGTAFSGCNNLQYNEYEDVYYLGNSENLYLVCVKAKNMDITFLSLSYKTKLILSYAFANCTTLWYCSI
ncbi:MAG: leucine-rich repeat protein, partial [Anaeroplasma bactoclasticum]|nr:leucine-rich repeat protein [Anaeroplasma bactoclasticum]